MIRRRDIWFGLLVALAFAGCGDGGGDGAASGDAGVDMRAPSDAAVAGDFSFVPLSPWERDYEGAELRGIAANREGTSVVVAGARVGDDLGGGVRLRTLFAAGIEGAGNARFEKTYGRSSGTFRAVSAIPGSTDFVLAGELSREVDFGLGVVTSRPGDDVLLLRITEGGDTVWARSYGGDGKERAHVLAVDAEGHLFIAGILEDGEPVDLGGGLVTPTSEFAFFVASYDGNGAHLWSRIFSVAEVDGDAEVDVEAIAFGEGGRTFVLGQLGGEVAIGSGVLTASDGGEDFLVELGADGDAATGVLLGDGGAATLASDARGGAVYLGATVDDADVLGTSLQSVYRADVDRCYACPSCEACPSSLQNAEDAVVMSLGARGQEVAWHARFTNAEMQRVGVDPHGEIALAAVALGPTTLASGPLVNSPLEIRELVVGWLRSDGSYLGASRVEADVEVRAMAPVSGGVILATSREDVRAVPRPL